MNSSTNKRKTGLVGLKIGMTQIFSEDGRAIPLTIIDVSDNYISQIKSKQVDGYTAIQLAFGIQKNITRLTKASIGHCVKAGVSPVSHFVEFPISEEDLSAFVLGQKIGPDIFSVGQKVDVRGVTIGKGFAGVIKRHHFSSNRASHGNSLSHRTPGSIGMCQDPGRVFPGKRMAGHLGCDRVSIQNLEVISICMDRCLMGIKGAVPGHKGSRVIVTSAVKVAA